MSAHLDHTLSALPDVTRGDRAGYVKLARRLRAEQLDRVFHAVGAGLARLGHTLTTAAAGGRATPGASARC